jgi:perosamine synthetase
MVVTNDAELAERCRSLRNLCFTKNRFVHEELGWNFRMSNLQGAVGIAQLERLDYVLERKRCIGRQYNALLKDVPALQLPLAATAYAENVYWAYGVVLNNNVPFDAAVAVRQMALQGVGCRPFFWPMHEQPVFERMGLFRSTSYPVAERLARRGFYIPSGAALSSMQQESVVRALQSVVAGS